MKGRTNAGGGSAFAVIDAAYPEGAACSCSNGVRTIQAENDSGQWMFVIPRAGEWTVTVTSGETSKSETVNVTESKVYSLEFTFLLVLFDNGSYAQETGGWSCISNSSLKISANSGPGDDAYGNGYSNRAVDFSPFKTLHFEGITTTTNNGSSTINARLSVGTTTTGGAAATTGDMALVTNASKTLDISGLTGSYYIQLYLKAWGDTYGTLSVSKVWME